MLANFRLLVYGLSFQQRAKTRQLCRILQVSLATIPNSLSLLTFSTYRGIQSAGACIAFGADAGKIPYLNEFASCWALLAGSLVIASPLIFTKIRDHVPIEEDLKFSDETFEEVAPQAQRSGSVDKH